ncbi:cytochrome c3 family protein [Desulfococcaceae bacterium HSG9]|nr:cytochrome c3 family protein [Desulfococcaceae bacterium HSG9]
MKQHSLKISLIITLIMMLMAAYSAHSQEEDVKTVEDDAFTEQMRPIVPFLHDEHNEIAEIAECGVCHHVYDDNGLLSEDETSEESQCSECHLPAKSKDKTELIKYYHNQCKNCHLQRNAGPIMCAECHVK